MKLVLGIALATAAAAGGASYQRPPRVAVAPETRVVRPLADPALVPGVARCTSDACTVTDALGTRATAPLAMAP